MKSKYIIQLVIVLLFSFVYGMEFTANLPAVDVFVKNKEGSAHFYDSDDLWDSSIYYIAPPGDPLLPVYFMSFILPDDVDYENIQVTIKNPKTETVSDIYVNPEPPYIDDPIDSTPYWPDGVTINEKGENVDIYENLNDWVYGTWILSQRKNGWKSVQILDIEIPAYDWHPQKKELKKLVSGDIFVVDASNNTTDNSLFFVHFSSATASHFHPIISEAANREEIQIKFDKYILNYHILSGMVEGTIPPVF